METHRHTNTEWNRVFLGRIRTLGHLEHSKPYYVHTDSSCTIYLFDIPTEKLTCILSDKLQFIIWTNILRIMNRTSFLYSLKYNTKFISTLACVCRETQSLQSNRIKSIFCSEWAVQKYFVYFFQRTILEQGGKWVSAIRVRPVSLLLRTARSLSAGRQRCHH